MNSSDLFKRAVDAYETQRLVEAAQLCREVLQGSPDHAACLHLLGVIEYQSGNPGEAESLMRKAVALVPGFAEMHFVLAQLLGAQSKFPEAIEQYQLAVKAKPQHVNALFALANALKTVGRHVEAAEVYAQTIKAKPDHAAALNNLGICYFERGLCVEAIDLYQRALAVNPDYAAALNNLGNALKAQEKWDEAIACYQRALELKPDLIQALNNLGLALLYGKTNLSAAAKCFEAVLALDPDFVPALTHLGITFCMQGAFDEGIKYYEKALALQPDYRDALNNMGNALNAVGRLTEAISVYERVKVMTPDDPEVHNNLAMTLLHAGRFDQGWQEYEWRWQTKSLASGRRGFTQPLWRGEEGQGRTLLIHAEQGFGDTLQFCRYAPLAAQRGWRVILEVQPELARLMGVLSGVEKVIARGEALPDFDAHCPMMSLPLAFGTRLESIPAGAPYLAADKRDVEKWGGRVGDTQDKKVGLVWSGNPRLFSTDLAAANMRRSIPFEVLTPLGKVPNTRFYSLQKDAPQFPAGLELINFMPECRDFADTAALIANLDLVISADTAVAHLAAALGKPVWLLNRFDTCWRWLQDREDSPWYPTLRLFLQKRSGDWGEVIERVCGELNRNGCAHSD